jgi:hypothetical protein
MAAICCPYGSTGKITIQKIAKAVLSILQKRGFAGIIMGISHSDNYFESFWMIVGLLLHLRHEPDY